MRLAINYLHYLKYILSCTVIVNHHFLGDDGVKMLKDGDEKPNVPSTIIAEKAVERLDQLQASEKLIAGISFYEY